MTNEGKLSHTYIKLYRQKNFPPNKKASKNLPKASKEKERQKIFGFYKEGTKSAIRINV